MQDPTTWTAGLFGTGAGAGAGADDLAEAQRRVAILKAELEAIRGGRKEASAAELRRLERDYREAVFKVGELQLAARPRPTVTPTRPIRGIQAMAPSVRGPGPTLGPAAGGLERPVRGIQEMAPSLRGPGAPAGYQLPPRQEISRQWTQNLMAPRFGFDPIFPGAGPSPAGAGAPIPPGGAPPTAGLWRPPGSAVAASERLKRPSYAATDPRYGRAYIPPAAAGAGGTWRDKPMEQWTGADYADYQEWLQQQAGQMTEYQAGSLEQQRAEAQALQTYRMAQLGQGQATAAATAAYRQQQAEQARAQLQQAWAVAQAELAHAQNVMASQIGADVAGMQSQIWAQGLPHALPQGTQVAPGFERGGPMSQLYRMSGSQFRPGTTGRISPHPGPSQQQLMDIFAQARQQYGAGR